MNRKWIGRAATMAVMACSGMSIQAPGVHAQSTKSDTMKGPEVEGRVRDIRSETVTLDDGTLLTVPRSQAKLGEMKAGNTYQERDGKKIVTSLQITEGPQAGSTK
jgi:hypothetical protein